MTVRQRQPASRPQHFASRPARSRQCRLCHAAIMAGLDRGMPVAVDASPIDPVGEVEALIVGRMTYGLHGTSTQPFLVLRDLERIRAGWPPGGVYRAHVCPSRGGR